MHKGRIEHRGHAVGDKALLSLLPPLNPAAAAGFCILRCFLGWNPYPKPVFSMGSLI